MKKCRWICLMLCAVLLCATWAQAAQASSVMEDLAAMLHTTAPGLLGSPELEPGEPVSDWIALSAGRNGLTEEKDRYLNKLWDYVSEQYQTQGGLDTVSATAWHRISLTVLALGADPTCFGEDADGNPINLIADGTYDWHRTDSLGTQGTNAWIYALLTLDAGGYEVPAGSKYTRQIIINAIIDAQLEDGGIDIGSGMADLDMTAMALQALAPYAGDPQVAGVIEKGLAYLSAAQTAQGDFMNGSGCSSESCAQVILALCALGIDPQTDGRFQKPGGSALDGLLLYRTGDGFSHLLGDDTNRMATQQAAQALTALDRLQKGQSRLYDFTGEDIRPFVPSSGSPVLWAGLGAGAAAAILMLIWKGRKRCTK